MMKVITDYSSMDMMDRGDETDLNSSLDTYQIQNNGH